MNTAARLRLPLAAAMLLVAIATAAAQDASPPERELKFRRIFAPSNGILEWPRGNVRYLPIEPQEFERLVQAAGGLPVETATALAAHVHRARYSARLDDDLLTTGQLVLDVVHAAHGPVLLPLAPCNLALASEEKTDDQQPPLLGTRADGRLMLLVERSGPLRFGWSLRGRRDATGAVDFELQLPQSADNRLELDLPAQTMPVASAGIVSPLGAGDASRRRWAVELGGEHRFSLRIAPSDPASQRRRLPLVRTATSYEFSSRGIDVTSQCRLDPPHDSLRQLEIAVDQGLQLVSAQYGETPIAWSSSPAAKEGPTRLVLELPDIARSPARTLKLTAMAPLRLDQALMLPRIEPQGVIWQEGTLSLLLPEPFQLRQLLTFSCQQSKIGPLPAELAGEALEFQCFGADATAQVLVGRQRDPLRVSSGVDIGISGGERTAHWSGNFEAASGERFHLLADVPRHWAIESLATVPEDDLADWHVVEADGSDRQLNVRLATPITANHPVHLVIEARGRSSPARVGPADVTVVKFRGATTKRELVGLRPIGPWQLQLDGQDEPLRVDPRHLSPADARLFSEPPPEVIIERSADGPRWWATAAPETPRYRARIDTQVEVAAGHLRHSWRVECTPDALPLEKVLVYLTQAGPHAPKWSYAEEKLGRLVPRKLSNHEQAAAGLAAAGEAWELRLNQPQSEPIEIRASREAPWNPNAAVSLACAPLASTQQATLAIRAAGDVQLEIQNTRLDASEPLHASDNRVETLRAAFRYDPQREAAAEASPAVRLVAAGNSPPQAGAVVWHERVEALYEPGGRVMQQASWDIESSGATACQVQLAQQARVIGLWVDGKPQQMADSRDTTEVQLPHATRFVRVVVQYEAAVGPWRLATLQQMVIPRINLPVVDREHIAWLPVGYSILRGGAVAAGREPSWSRRLFGLLGRDGQQPPFDPTRKGDWAALSNLAQDHESSIALALLGDLGRRALTQKGPRGLNFGQWLAGAKPAGAAAGQIPAIVDRQALADAGLWPSSPVTLNPASLAGQQDAARGLSIMQASGLALLVGPDAVLVTTSAIASAEATQLTSLGMTGVYAVNTGALQRQIRAGAAHESARFVHTTAWRAELPPPWHWAGTGENWQPNGWRPYRLETALGESATFIVIDALIVYAAAALSALLAIVVGAWWVCRGLPTLLGLACAFAAAALLLPAELAPVASGGLLGCVAALLARMLLPRPRGTPGAVASPAAPGSTATRLAGGAATLLALALSLSQAFGAEPAGGRDASDVYRVFIPSDDQGKATGQRYLVPEELYKGLLERSLEARGEPEGWLLRRAHYEATLEQTMGGGALAPRECVAHFEIEILSPATRIVIPLGPAGLAEVPRQALLDGRAVTLEWPAKRQAFELLIDDPGTYHLEVPLRPVVRTLSDGAGFEVGIARHPLSSMTLHLPPEAPEPQLPLTAGPLTRSDDGHTLHALLGTADQWVVHWPPAASGRSGPTFDVEELLWLKVRPGSVLLEVKAQLAVAGGQLNRLQVLADPRLRLLPLSGSGWRLVESRVPADELREAGEPRELHFQPASPISDQGTWHATFLLTGTSAFGNLRLPQMDVLGGRATRRWLAVNVDPALEFDVQDGQQTHALTPTSFTTHWGPSSVAPQVACELPAGELNWTLATHPRQPRTTAHQRLALCVGSSNIDVRYDAQLLTTDGYTFQHRLLAPKELEIDSVSVLEDGVQLAAHWGRDRSGNITVLLTAPVTGAQQLSLEGRLPCPAVGQLGLPLVKLEDTTFKDTPLLVYRRASVLATVENQAALAEAAERPDPGRSPWPRERLAASLVATGETPSAELRIAPNAGRASVVQVISLAREASGWQATSDSVWTVADGLLDTLRFEIPQNWTGPFSIAPAADYEVISLPAQREKHLLVRPHSPIRDKYRLTITGPLAAAPDKPVSMSDVRPLGVEVSRRLFRLPRQAGLQQIIWETSDLRPAELPPELRSASPAEPADILQTAGSGGEVRLKAVDRVTAAAQIKLADIRVRLKDDGSLCGLALFDVEPAHGSRCRFSVPADCHLLRVMAGGLIATPLSAGQGLWEVPLPAGHLPQRIEMIFNGRHAPRALGRYEFAVPTPHGVPVEKTLCTVEGPEASGPGEILGGKSAGALRAEVLRLQAIVALAALPGDAGSGSGSDELKSWYQLWQRHWDSARRAARRRLLELPHNAQSTAAEAEIKAAEREQAALAQRFGASDVSAPPAHEPADLWSEIHIGSRPPARSVFDGAITTLAVRYPHPERAGWWIKLSIVCTWLLVAVLVWIAAGRGVALADWLRRWPHPLAMLLSLAWWLWLSPSALGLLGAGVVLVLSLRSGLKRARDASPSVLRLGTTR